MRTKLGGRQLMTYASYLFRVQLHKKAHFCVSLQISIATVFQPWNNYFINMLVAMPIDPRNLTQCASPFCEKLCLQLQHIQDGAGRPGYKGNHKKRKWLLVRQSMVTLEVRGKIRDRLGLGFG